MFPEPLDTEYVCINPTYSILTPLLASVLITYIVKYTIDLLKPIVYSF